MASVFHSVSVPNEAVLPLATPLYTQACVLSSIVSAKVSPLAYPLAQATVGQWVRLGRITDDATELLAMRLGLSEGALLRIKAKLPAGPLVVVCGPTELALGRDLCHSIPVHSLE